MHYQRFCWHISCTVAWKITIWITKIQKKNGWSIASRQTKSRFFCCCHQIIIIHKIDRNSCFFCFFYFFTFLVRILVVVGCQSKWSYTKRRSNPRYNHPRRYPSKTRNIININYRKLSKLLTSATTSRDSYRGWSREGESFYPKQWLYWSWIPMITEKRWAGASEM